MAGPESSKGRDDLIIFHLMMGKSTTVGERKLAKERERFF